MFKHDGWPAYCEVVGCTHPTDRPHHHHFLFMRTDKLNNYACTCGDIAEPGTSPKPEEN